MVDVMDSNIEQGAEHSGVAGSEVEESSPSPESPAPPSPPENPASTTAPASKTPVEKTVKSARRTVVKGGVDAGARVISGVWLYFRKFDKAVNNKGQNTQCQVKEKSGELCGRLYKHVPGNGTTPLLDHLKAKHPAEYKEAMESSTRSKDAKAKKGKAFAEAAAGPSGLQRGCNQGHAGSSRLEALQCS